jgi:two-component system chemotaxis response regulator CheB
MAKHDIIVIGASAGGVQALLQLVQKLPAGLPASLFIVCHFPSDDRSALPEILSRVGPLLATHATDGEPFNPGHIYVAPPDHHLLLGRRGSMHLTRTARENHHRPAIDPLFRSAARHFGTRVVAIILSGSLYDGTAGLMAVRAAGGLAIVQDPSDAAVAAMPKSASQIAGADYVVALADMAPLLVKLIKEPVESRPKAGAVDPIERITEAVDRDMEQQVRNERRGGVSTLTCPDCGGALWQVDEAGLIRFRCHVGHSYLGEDLLNEQSEALEAALWTAIRTFREKSVLARQLAHIERTAGRDSAAARFEEQAGQAARFGELIQHLLLDGGPAAQDAAL